MISRTDRNDFSTGNGPLSGVRVIVLFLGAFVFGIA